MAVRPAISLPGGVDSAHVLDACDGPLLATDVVPKCTWGLKCSTGAGTIFKVAAAQEVIFSVKTASRPRSTKTVGLLPKTEPLQGSLYQEWKRCGKPRCRCAKQGTEQRLHGPYFYRFYRHSGVQHRQYVRQKDVEAAVAGIQRWHDLHPPAWLCHQEIRALLRLVKLEFGR